MMAKAAGNSDSLPPTAVAPLLDSTQVATRMMTNNLFLSIYADLAKVSPGQTALGARSLVRNAGQGTADRFILFPSHQDSPGRRDRSGCWA